MIPSATDGLLTVQRRTLLGAHCIAKAKFVKTLALVGEVIGKWHPHGEAGIPGVADWAIDNGYMIGSGLWGSDVGKNVINPAAPRYTEIKAHPFTEEIAFKLIDYVEWSEGEMDYTEPKTLPTMFPFCLMAENELVSIGFGLKPRIPCYSRDSLRRRLLSIIKKEKGPIIMPQIKGCKYIDKDVKIFEELLTTGKATFKIRGNFTFSESNYEVHIKGWSPRVGYESIEQAIDRFEGLGLISNEIVGSNDLSTDTTDIVFTVIKRNNKDQIFPKLVKAISNALTATITYDMKCVDNGKVVDIGVDGMLYKAYNFYSDALKRSFEIQSMRTTELIDEYKLIEKLRPSIQKVLKDDITDMELIYTRLSELSGVRKEDVRSLCSKHTIHKLLIIDTDISEYNKRLKELQKNIKNYKEISLQNYMSIF
jgi:DNA gyrase subunit A